MSEDLIYDKSALIQVIAWCRQAASHYLRQCWPDLYSPVSQWLFPQQWAAQTTCISSYVRTTNFRFFCNISQILLLYKTWEYYNKFDATKSLGVCYWYAKITHGYMEHGLKNVAFYVQKHIAPWAICYNRLLVRDMPLEVPAFVRLVYMPYGITWPQWVNKPKLNHVE